MKEKIMTPTQIWGNYDPNKQPLEPTILKIVEDNNTVTKYLSFTAESTLDGKVIAIATLMYKKNAKSKMPAVLICSSDAKEHQIGQLTSLIDAGFIVATFDYAGKEQGKEFFTKYPPSLAFCNVNASAAPSELQENNDASIYHWTIIARRTISILCQEPLCDSNNIGIIGILTATDIMWQVAATDNRIKTCIPILNFGWQQESNLLARNIEENSLSYNDYISKIGFAVESYIGLVKCDTLFVGATHSMLTSIDKIEDTINRLPKTITKTTCITVGNDSHLGNASLPTIIYWLKTILMRSKGVFPTEPLLNITVNKKQEIEFNITYDKSQKIDNIQLFISDGEQNPILRNWHSSQVPMDESNTASFKYIPTDNATDIFAFVNVNYKNGFTVSSNFKTFNTLTNTNIKKIPLVPSRIIFDSNSSIESFLPQSKKLFSIKEDVVKKYGPYNIYGASTDQPILTTYIIGDSLYRGQKNYLLHIDFYSPVDKTVKISLQYMDLETNTILQYVTDINIKDTGEWQSCLFSKEDFKEDANKTLPDWENVKAITFTNIENVIINNILWV